MNFTQLSLSVPASSSATRHGVGAAAVSTTPIASHGISSSGLTLELFLHDGQNEKGAGDMTRRSLLELRACPGLQKSAKRHQGFARRR